MMAGIKKWIYFLGLCGLCIQAFSITEPTQGAGRFKLVVADSEGLDVSPDFAVDFGGEQSAPVLNLQLAGDATIELSWDGDYRLFHSQAIDQPFQEVVGASSPYAVTMSDQGFYKLKP